MYCLLLRSAAHSQYFQNSHPQIWWSAMSTTAARSDPVLMKDDSCKMFVHPGHQDAQDSMRMREAKMCGCSADILRERRRAKDEPLMFSASCCCSSSCVEIPKVPECPIV